MPKIHDGDTPHATATEPPEILKPFEALGFDISWRPGQREGIGTCPLCLGEGKFYVNTETGQWNCRKGCWSGNKDSLLQAIWDRSIFDAEQAIELAKSRTLLDPQTLEAWGFRKLLTDGQWVTPGYSSGGKIVDLYRWVRDPHTKKHRLWSTPEYHHGIHGIPVWDKEKSNVLVCEGIWDGMAAWELLRTDYNVLAIPGANNLPDRCLPDLGGKEVGLFFHSDHPKENKITHQKMEPVGYQGMKRAAGIMKGLHPERAPKSIQYCYWGDEGYDPQKKDGFDIRDALGHLSSPEDRREQMDALLCNMTAIPQSWPVVKGGSEELTPLPCSSWEVLRESWTKAMLWTPGLDKALAVCLASVVSTQTVGEQLWIKVMGPPSCISGRTHIAYVVRTPEGKITSKHGGSLAKLYRRFKKLPQVTAGQRERTDCDLLVQSVDGEGRIIRNKIQDVLYKGQRNVYLVTTMSGKQLEATSDHEFLTPTGYVHLDSLREGDLVMVNHGKAQKKGRKEATYRKEVLVKQHPTAAIKNVNGYLYRRLFVYRAVYEAHMNGLTYEQYIHLLNTAHPGRMKYLWTLSSDEEIHHKDEDPTNNSIENLELVKGSSKHHLDYHLEDSKKQIAIYATPEAIKSISYVGPTDVYDIVCSDPYRNFAAGGVIVHNCGKTTIAEALAVAKKYVYSRDQLTGLHSGYKSDKEGTEDHSLLHKIIGKTFVLKDGDTLLQSSNLGQILSEFRAAYDGSSRVYYRHGVDRAYENFRFTWILLGTSSLRALDSSELGARFVDCIVMDKIDADLERKVLKYVVQKSIRNAAVVVNGKAETSQDIRLVRAKRLTGGYVNYLRENAGELMGDVEIGPEREELIMQCGEFVAFLRARESTKQKEVAEREFSSRLVEQYARLTICLAVVMGRPKVDDTIMARVREIAMDTARGRSLNLVRYLYPLGQMGCDPTAARIAMGDEEVSFNALLRYLRKIEVLEHFQATGAGWVGTRTRWRLTQRIRELYRAVAKP